MSVEDWLEENNHIRLSCPECSDINYEVPITCTTCWCEGGSCTISLKTFIYEILGYKNEKEETRTY